MKSDVMKLFKVVFITLFARNAMSIRITNLHSQTFQVLDSNLRQAVINPATKLGLVKRLSSKMENGRPDFCNGLDCPPFKELNKTKDYELREYAESSWVSTQLQKVDYDDASGTMFMKLFGYIEGSNVKKEKIKMTAPVIVKATPGQGPACKDDFTMSFFVSSKVTDPPAPSAADVFLSKLPKQNVFVRSFGGRAHERDWIENAEKLAASLVKDKRKFVKDYFYTAGYDSPFRLFNRHNEVWFIAQE